VSGAGLTEMVRSELEHELIEAKAELRRHHQDFERIRRHLDEAEFYADQALNLGITTDRTALLAVRGHVKSIRNVDR
jgi:flagellar biosynthesis/type III secretory pathway protein FliH